MSNAFAPIVRARPIPIFGRPVHQGSPPIDYSPILLLKPFGFRIAPDTLSSDENLVGQRGITPAFGYSAPHPSAGGTLTLLIHALPSARYVPNPPRAPREAGELVVMWLKSAGAIVRWGPREDAMRFATKGEARRVARTL